MNVVKCNKSETKVLSVAFTAQSVNTLISLLIIKCLHASLTHFLPFEYQSDSFIHDQFIIHTMQKEFGGPNLDKAALVRQHGNMGKGSYPLCFFYKPKNEAKLHSQLNFPERKTKNKPSQKLMESLYRKTTSLHASLDRGRPEPCSKGSASCHSNCSWSWVAGSLMTSLDSSEDDSGSFGGWEGCYFWSFVLSVCFVGLFSAVCVDLCAFVWGKGIHVFAEISFFTFLTCSYLVVLETLIRWLKQYCENSVQRIRNQAKNTLKYIQRTKVKYKQALKRTKYHISNNLHAFIHLTVVFISC